MNVKMLLEETKKLESTFLFLKNQQQEQKEKINELRKENARLMQTIEGLESQMIDLNGENNSLKNLNALLGSNSYKTETKIKINSLIRQIDYCISELSEK